MNVRRFLFYHIACLSSTLKKTNHLFKNKVHFFVYASMHIRYTCYEKTQESFNIHIFYDSRKPIT